MGTIKGLGRIYQQTFVDTYSTGAAAKPYTTKTPITGADLLNDGVVHSTLLCGTGHGPDPYSDRPRHEYCGKPETHDYQLYLALNDIEHTHTKAHPPQTSGICERFHKTILQEFYRSRFRRKIYRSQDIPVARYTGQSKSCKSIWTIGCTTTITIGLTTARCVGGAKPCANFS